MKRFLYKILIGCILVCNCASNRAARYEIKTISKIVDKFQINNYRISVLFFDPYENIHKRFPLYYKNASEPEKLAMWKEFAINYAAYMFTAKDAKKNILKYYCLKIDPGTVLDGKDLVLEVISPGDVYLNDPIMQEYKRHIILKKRIPDIGGFLFDHMAIFADKNNKRFITEGLLFHGEFFNVAKYRQIKEAVSKIIFEDLVDHNIKRNHK